jgi:hypothetical protein
LQTVELLEEEPPEVPPGVVDEPEPVMKERRLIPKMDPNISIIIKHRKTKNKPRTA